MIRRLMRWWIGEWSAFRERCLRTDEFQSRATYLVATCGYGRPRKVYRWRERWGVWQFTGVRFAAPEAAQTAKGKAK